MIAYFILGLALLVGVILVSRWFASAEPKQVVRIARWTAAGLGIVVALWFLFAGRQALAVMALPALIPLLLRARYAWRRYKAASGPSQGQNSEVVTRFLRMTLDHDTGVMSGVVLDGEYRGRRLDELSIEELLALRQACRAGDQQSVAVLDAYLDREKGDAWREAAAADGQPTGGGPAGGGAAGDQGQGAAASGGAMTRDEAYEVLGLEPGASDEDIRAAHRRLMQQMHPDHGGSNYLAAKINQAKQKLLGR